MSLTAQPPAAVEIAAPAQPKRGSSLVRLWAGVVLAVALLTTSLAVRVWQGQRFDQVMREGRKPPFTLSSLPVTLGPWQGSDEQLDPRIAQATGSTDHVFRSFIDTRTGVQLSVIILYGPAAEVFIHAPDNCYPAQGYHAAEDVVTRVMDPDGVAAPFQATIYAKGEGGQAEREDVYHCWYYSGRWTPELPIIKHAERIPGMLKVHVWRRASDGEFRDNYNPCEDFLNRLVPEIQRRLVSAGLPPSV
ncbi:MAG: exosortase-associated EpsI family protein [Isosphaeraceae bacterium]